MDIIDRQIKIYRGMTPDRRWQEALRLYDFAREFKAAAIRNLHPEWSEQRVRAEVRKVFLYAHT
jgi:hypothetical protein